MCAKTNSEKLNLNNRISFLHDDILRPLPKKLLSLQGDCNKRFDIIISNPPYISTKEVEKLEKNVKDVDPKTALDGGIDGLDFYRAIANNYKKLLKPNGKMYLEIGFDQADSVSNLFENSEIIYDYGNNPRIVKVQRRR